MSSWFQETLLRAAWRIYRIQRQDPPPSEYDRFAFRFHIRLYSYFNRPKALNPVFIIGAPRCGSNLLSGYLNSHPAIQIVGELLNVTREPVGIPANYSKNRALLHLEQALQWAQRPVCGAKFFFVHLRRFQISFDDLLERYPAARFLILYRSDLSAQLISTRLLAQTGFAVGQKTDATIRLEAAEIDHFYREMQTDYHNFVSDPRLRGRAAVLSYENLVANPESCFQNIIWPLLQLEPAPLVSQLTKQNDRAPDKIILNYDEIAQKLNQPSGKLILKEGLIE